MEQRSVFDIGSYLHKRCLVFGCGNPLFGDDGFGAEVIEHLTARYTLPGDVACLDAGTAVRDMLFDMLLSAQKPQQILIIDAMDLAGAAPGEIHEIDIDQINPAKICDFSLHQFPTTNMLKEIKEGTDIRIRILVVQTADLPDEVRPGLSEPVKAAVPGMCQRILSIIKDENGGTA
jgi:coenzyme F420 hydrogenase subunit delta